MFSYFSVEIMDLQRRLYMCAMYRLLSVLRRWCSIYETPQRCVTASDALCSLYTNPQFISTSHTSAFAH